MIEKAQIESFRRELKPIADKANALRKTGAPDLMADPSEVYANLTLAYRHLEDASMRLGKVIQALDGGVSVYDKDQVPVSQPNA